MLDKGKAVRGLVFAPPVKGGNIPRKILTLTLRVV